MIELSTRLQHIAGKIKAGSRLADIGSDHALLPVYLVEQGVIPYAIAVEINPGPLEAAKRQVEQSNLQHRIEVRMGDGLAVIQPQEVDAVTIAGMGGALIAAILTEGNNKLEHVHQLVLQPNVGEEVVRRWLVEHDWCLIEEDIVCDGDHIYEVLHAAKLEQADEHNRLLYDADVLQRQNADFPKLSLALLYRMGPYLLQQPEPAFFIKWEREVAKLERICQRLTLSTLDASQKKLNKLQQEIKEIKEVLACLQKVRR